MRRSLYLAAALVALAGSGATTGAKADTLRIGAMPVGSGWYVAASTLEKTLLEIARSR